MFEEKDKILEYIGTIKQLEQELRDTKKELKDLQEKYLNLRARYTNQNDELLKLKVLLSKEVENEDKRN